MPVALLCCRRPDAISATPTPAGLIVRSACAGHDGWCIARLGDAVAGDVSDHAAPRPRGPGLLAELTSRPGRDVEAWLAVMPERTDQVVGLISLVRCPAATGARHSIGWLLVHPGARRRGVARALTAQAARRAVELAAEAVWVECRSDWSEALGFWRAIGFEERPRDSAGLATGHQPNR